MHVASSQRNIQELYENELADIIADLNPATISVETLDSDKKFIADAILDWNSDLIDAYKQGLMERFHFKDDIVKKACKEHLDSDFKELTDAVLPQQFLRLASLMNIDGVSPVIAKASVIFLACRKSIPRNTLDAVGQDDRYIQSTHHSILLSHRFQGMQLRLSSVDILYKSPLR